MNQNNHFELRYKRLTVEALIRSLFCGLIVAFGADFALGLALWISGTQNLKLTIALICGAFVLVTLAAAAIFYYAKFKPTITANARRIDGMGLEERVVTMLEFKDSDTLMAKMQRDDAIRALETVNEKSIKFQFSRKVFIAMAICGFFGLAMNTVASLSAAGLFPSGMDIIDKVLPEDPPVYIPVSYMADEGGSIDGEEEQLVLLGENAEPVTAIPEEGYTFEGWDDGYKKPTRNDKGIDHPLVLMAIFLPIEDEGDDGGDDEHGENGEQPGEQEGEGDQEGDSDQEGDQEGDTPSENGGGGKYNKENQIIDGNTYYREFLEEYRDKIMELLKKSTEELTEEERAILEKH